ncbi:biotin transporter BioY [Palleronia caenipelagi]|uniref:Biotin transporter n=1 Tax=Palleronia caenipelagi TaxID=2489174 RepID=A0A547Q7K4_9RHOB|nr:biotin transporter BioY [Palleronia caenipelagi]TRD22354.1 biotin transporter BioY [Palleronia caenipelagi]
MTQATPLLRGQDRAFWQQAALVLGGSALIAVAAQVAVPLWPVPVTLQTLAILMVGLTLGSRLGAMTVLAYLAEGAMGLPVFANGGAGLAYMAGPTGGFLLGYVAMAWFAGFAIERGLARGVISTAVCSLYATAMLYIPGVAWPFAVASAFGVEAAWASTSALTLWTGWVLPFLIGDAIKAVLAAVAVTGLSRRKA